MGASCLELKADREEMSGVESLQCFQSDWFACTAWRAPAHSFLAGQAAVMSGLGFSQCHILRVR